MQPGDTFLYRHPGMKKHLLIIICTTETDPVVGKIFHCVYLTTLYNTGDEDTVCSFCPNDHPFINHDSYIEYSQLLHICADYLQTQIAIGSAISKEPITPDQLLKIKSAAANSVAIHPNDLRYFK